MNYKNNVLEMIGRTPIIRINESNIYAKVEYFNPGGSIKDRVSYAMLKEAMDNGNINKETIIIEPTSGNTGIGLAMCCAVLGLKLILTMPESMSIERRKVLEIYGADLILTKANLGMQGAVDKANELLKIYLNSYMPSQFSNKACQNIHYQTTAKEIYDTLDGNIDIFVAGVGTGATISAVGKYLKEKNSKCLIVAVEPESSPLISQGKSGPHKIQGIGANFIPDNYDNNVVDKVITISDENAILYAKKLAQENGLLVGISSGAAYKASLDLANMVEYKNKTIVVIFPDTGLRYLSTELFCEE